MTATKLDRQDLLGILECVKPGLAQRESTEQGKCFVFQNGRVWTYNEELACHHASKLKTTAAVPADYLLNILRKIGSKTVEVTTNNGELRFQAGKERFGIKADPEISLPLDTIEKPGQWVDVSESMIEGLNEVYASAAAKDENRFEVTCVHIHPNWVEGCDPYQMMRYRVKTGLENPVLIKQSSAKHVAEAKMTRMSETEGWLHFKRDDGMVISCRKYLDEFPDLSPLLKAKEDTKLFSFPESLAQTTQAVEKAEVFSSSNVDNNLVIVKLKPNTMVIKGEGAAGWYRKAFECHYSGPSITFVIPPKLLVKTAEKQGKVEIGEKHLRIKSEKWTFVSCIGKEDAKEEA